jgi:hypothetical protein
MLWARGVIWQSGALINAGKLTNANDISGIRLFFSKGHPGQRKARIRRVPGHVLASEYSTIPRFLSASLFL